MMRRTINIILQRMIANHIRIVNLCIMYDSARCIPAS